MSKKRMMIELQAPETMRERRAEGFIVKGFACPVCSGNGWNFAKDVEIVQAIIKKKIFQSKQMFL